MLRRIKNLILHRQPAVNNLTAGPWLKRAKSSGSAPVEFSPADLFASGEEGAWYDPSDFSTMWQDSVGTAPVTAVGQPVGLILDKSKGLAVSAEKLTSPNFDSATGWTLSAGFTISGGNLNINASSGNAQNAFLGMVGKAYSVTIDVVSIAGGTIAVAIANATNEIASSGVKTFTAYGAANNYLFILVSTGTPNAVIASVSVKEIDGNHAAQITAAARPVLQQDGNGKYYLGFDGVDDSLSTAAIDFTSTDKMSVFSGVRKVSTSTGIISELSASADTEIGSFVLYGNNTEYNTYPRGTNGSNGKRVVTFTSPITNVLTFELDMSLVGMGAGTKTYRVNGVVPSFSSVGTTSLAAGGNFGTWPIYIGRRGGSAYSFNGNIYSLIIRGALSTTQEITDTETWVNSKTGAY